MTFYEYFNISFHLVLGLLPFFLIWYCIKGIKHFFSISMELTYDINNPQTNSEFINSLDYQKVYGSTSEGH